MAAFNLKQFKNTKIPNSSKGATVSQVNKSNKVVTAAKAKKGGCGCGK